MWMNLFVLWLFLAVVKFLWTVLTEWSLHTHSKLWQHFQSVLLSLAVGQTEHLPCRLLLLFFTFVWEAGCFQGTPIALRALQYDCWHFHYQPYFIYVVTPFLLPEKADTYFYNSFSFVVNWDISASTVQMHLHK
jgi:hypothetical protein